MHDEDAPGRGSTSPQDLLELPQGICPRLSLCITRPHLELGRQDGLPPLSLEVPEIESADPPRQGTSSNIYGLHIFDDSLAHSLFDEALKGNRELEATGEVQDVHTVGRGIFYL